MLINEVIHIVGLSRKSIRYYEDVGLLSPTRNKNNDYRMYTEEDIKKLKTIKFLRELDVQIKDLKLLNNNKLTLQDCLKERIKNIELEEKNYNKIKNMCTEIINANDTYENIDITKYFKEINILNKEGFTMKKKETNHRKKILGAVISSLIFELFFIILVTTITYFQMTETDKMPWILFIFFILLFLFPIITIIINLITRIKEIKGGEEDEASKY